MQPNVQSSVSGTSVLSLYKGTYGARQQKSETRKHCRIHKRCRKYGALKFIDNMPKQYQAVEIFRRNGRRIFVILEIPTFLLYIISILASRRAYPSEARLDLSSATFKRNPNSSLSPHLRNRAAAIARFRYLNYEILHFKRASTSKLPTKFRLSTFARSAPLPVLLNAHIRTGGAKVFRS